MLRAALVPCASAVRSRSSTAARLAPSRRDAGASPLARAGADGRRLPTAEHTAAVRAGTRERTRGPERARLFGVLSRVTKHAGEHGERFLAVLGVCHGGS